MQNIILSYLPNTFQHDIDSVENENTWRK